MTMKLEVLIIQQYKSRLIIAIQDNVSAIGDECQTRGLISEDTHSRVTHTTGSLTNADKARCLLKAVTNCITTTPSCFKTFVKILSEKLPGASQKIVYEMNECLKERTKIAASIHTDDESSVSGIEDVLKPCTVLTESDCNQSLTATAGTHSKSAGAHSVEQPDGVHSPILVSKLAEGKSAYSYSYLSCDVCQASMETSLRRQTLEHALVLIGMADLDAKQDEARCQSLQQQNDELRTQRRQLKKALEKEKKLNQELEDKRSNLQALISEKEKETTEMKCEIEALKTKISGTESQRDIFRRKSSKLEKELSSIEHKYNARISTAKSTITSLEKKLRDRESTIEQKAKAVRDRSREMERLLCRNQELVRQHGIKDEKISSLQHKLSMVEEALERGHRCSQLTHVFFSWFLLVLVGMLIVCVSIYKYVYP